MVSQCLSVKSLTKHTDNFACMIKKKLTLSEVMERRIYVFALELFLFQFRVLRAMHMVLVLILVTIISYFCYCPPCTE